MHSPPLSYRPARPHVRKHTSAAQPAAAHRPAPPRLCLMHTWSRLHPCAPTGACPQRGTLLASTLARQRMQPCAPT